MFLKHILASQDVCFWVMSCTIPHKYLTINRVSHADITIYTSFSLAALEEVSEVVREIEQSTKTLVSPLFSTFFLLSLQRFFLCLLE